MKSALVLSPFATSPLDAGHRRRVFQTTELLRRQGYRITFVLYAFEGAWCWGFDEAHYATMRAQWDEVVVYHAEAKVGGPPGNGRLHALDEWWNPDLGRLLDNLFSHRFFDVFVVHNVWLSKAFDCAPTRTIKVLDTHDLFWIRRDIYDRMDAPNDFFLPSRADELFGIGRADLAVMIQEAEARLLLGATETRVVTMPFYDNDLEAGSEFVPRTDYLSPDKVTFGFLGSAHVFNVRGMQAVLDALMVQIGRTFAPVDVVVGGDVQDHLWTDIPLRRLGRVPDEMTLYRQCDFALAPNFDGTGFKVKMADCLALGVPVLAASHAALGTSLKRPYVVETPEEMAALMTAISLNRPDLSAANAAVAEARADLRRRGAIGLTNLMQVLRTLRVTTVVDLRAFDLATGVLPLVGWLSLLRHVGGAGPVLAILADEVAAAVGRYLPVGVRALPASAAAAEVLARLGKRVLDPSGTGPERLGVGRHDLYAADRRWLDAQAADAATLPFFHPDVAWEPAVQQIRRRWRKGRKPADLPAPIPDTVVFVDHVAETTPSRVLTLARRVWLVNLHRAADFEAALLSLLEAPEGAATVVWASALCGAQHRMVVEVCALRRLAFHGCLPGGAVAAGVPTAGGGAFSERVAAGVKRLFDAATPTTDGKLRVAA